MIHMIDDNIEAYRRAVADTAKARTILQLLTFLDSEDEWEDNLSNCLEEEQLRLDGLKSVIGMAIREYAAREPHNPFAINGDVNQPSMPPPRRD